MGKKLIIAGGALMAAGTFMLLLIFFSILLLPEYISVVLSTREISIPLRVITFSCLMLSMPVSIIGLSIDLLKSDNP